MSADLTLLARACRALNEHEVRYLVVGDRARQLAGQQSDTLDLDLLLEATPDNASRALGALTGLGFGPAVAGLATVVLARAVTVIGVHPAVALIPGVGRLAFEAAHRQSATAELQGIPIPYSLIEFS